MDAPLVSSLYDVGTSQDLSLEPQHGGEMTRGEQWRSLSDLHTASLLQAKPSCAKGHSTTGRNCVLGMSTPSLLSCPAMLCSVS